MYEELGIECLKFRHLSFIKTNYRNIIHNCIDFSQRKNIVKINTMPMFTDLTTK